MQKRLHFKAVLQSPEKGWVCLFIPNDLLGTARRVWLEGTLNGKPFRATANPWRNETHRVAINKEMRSRLEVDAGDEALLVCAVSDFPPAAEEPLDADIASALAANPAAEKQFTAMPRPRRKQHLLYIYEAQSPDLRAKRIARFVERLGEEAAI
jgi:hypothetical protein